MHHNKRAEMMSTQVPECRRSQRDDYWVGADEILPDPAITRLARSK